MKRVIYILFVIMIAINASCQSSKQKERVVLGWIDYNSYRVSVSGTPNGRLTNIELRKMSSKMDAVKNAQHKIGEDFKVQKVHEIRHAGFDKEDFDPEIKKIIREAKASIKNGKIIKESFDDTQSCTIIYEIQYPDLQNIVKNYILEYN